MKMAELSAWVDPFCTRNSTEVTLLSQKQLLQITLHWLGTEGQCHYSGDMHRVSEFDLKRTIALSALRQLGLMIITISIGLSGFTFFRLLTHALFKALLFMCAGGVIHSMGDSQDIRFMGWLSIYIPFTSSSLMVSDFALCGTPFLAGFYSRDFILEIFSVRYVDMFGMYFCFHL
jgi:NADH:ubiquinone oxidoreductase subunit 5 (subunit L)/multisubunit Na+/H+ antiporter MnhA subunit